MSGNLAHSETLEFPGGEPVSTLTADDRLEIENLQRLYAQATDGLGGQDEVAKAQSLATYERIFMPNVQITTSNTGAEPLTASSPQGWYDVVASALAHYTSTQHMIGTQVVTGDALGPHLESYLSAWHFEEDGSVQVFLGTYIDEIVRDGSTWKIASMNLRHTGSYTLPVRT